MIDGAGFISLALQLAGSDKEERLRTSVSRAYYGAYHIVRSLFESCGVLVPRRDIHNKLQWGLEQCGEKMGHQDPMEIGSKLGSLRSERNRADYNLEDATYSKQSSTMLAVAMAQQIVDVLATMRSDAELAHLRPHVRNFAQQQGWPLRSS